MTDREVTSAAYVKVVRNADGLDVCAGCGAPLIFNRGGMLRVIHHWPECLEMHRLSDTGGELPQ